VSLFRYEFLPKAEGELAEAITYYDAVKSGLGIELAVELERVIQLLLDNPFAGKVAQLPTKVAYREFLLHRFPYRVIYSVEEDCILIVAVLYQGRRPGYWQSRVQEEASRYAAAA
jgi:plasmid stabilization system protein ParE